MSVDARIELGDAALARCISCSVEEFAEKHWGRAPLLSKADELGGGSFSDLFSAAAADQLITDRGLRTPFIRMAKEGTDLPASAFTRSAGVGASVPDLVGDDKVLSAMTSGATLVFQGLHRTWGPLMRFGQRLSFELGHPVQINAYVTPPQNQGFAPHYDTHDVLILQVSGRKRWTIREPVFPAPLKSHPHNDRIEEIKSRAGDEPLLETVLEPGDAIYLPRGTIHSAVALGEMSIHLTLGILPVTRYEVLQKVLDRARDDLDLRTSLPMGVDLADPAVMADVLEDTLAALRSHLDTVSAAQVAKDMGKELRIRTRPEPVSPITQMTAAAELTAFTPVRLRGQLRYQLDILEDKIQLLMVDRTIELRLAAESAIKTILTGEPVTAAELPGLDAPSQLTFVRGLLGEGVIVPA